MRREIHVGDTGTQFIVTLVDDGVPVQVDAGDEVRFKFEKPDRTVLDVVGEIVDGNNGLVRYITQANDLDLAGQWRLQIALTTLSPAWTGHSEKRKFEVDPVLG